MGVKDLHGDMGMVGRKRKMGKKVWVRWFDGYMEEFETQEVRFGSDLLFLRLINGENRHIPLRQVRWFGLEKESHAKAEG